VIADISREKVVVALGYVRTLLQEGADDAEERLLRATLVPDAETRCALRIFEERHNREQRRWALERIVTLTAAIEKRGGERPHLSKSPFLSRVSMGTLRASVVG